MPKGSGGARGGGHDEERLLLLLGRMRMALQLGKRPSPRKDGEWKWANTDAQVQARAVRAIAAFVAAMPPRPSPVPHLQAYIEDAVAALEYLLAVEQEPIYTQAAVASARLGRATSGRYMLRLLSPLACLLSPSKASEAAISAATAMQTILVTVRPQTAMGDDPIWRVLQESEALKHIVWRLDRSRAGIGVAECSEVLAMVMERWAGARYRVGKVEAVRACLLDHCMSSNEAVVVASLRACQALENFRHIVTLGGSAPTGSQGEAVLCAGVAVLFLQDGTSLWDTLAHCLQQSKPLLVNREALRLLSLLGRLSLFTASFKGPQMHAILEGCLRNINEGNRLRLTAVQQGVVVEAAHATSVILRWGGEHHNVVLGLGIFKLVFLQLTLGEKKFATNAKIWEGASHEKFVDVEWNKSRGAGKVTSSLRSLLWEIVGCLAAHSNASTTKEVLQGRPPAGPGLGGITVFACATLLRALHRSGHVAHTPPNDHTLVNAYGSGQEQHISGQELLQICRTMFFLLSSTSQDVATPTKACMETAMKFQDQAWLPRLVQSLTLGHTVPSPVKPEIVQTATNLFALACFSHFPECRELLPQELTLDVLTAILKTYGERALAQVSTTTCSVTCSAKWSVVHQRAGIASKTCCEEITEDWEGSDTVLIASLCAFTTLAQGSDRARVVSQSLRTGRLNEVSCSEGLHGDTVRLLWRLAECTTLAAGVRCWAASGLACFNVYGFPSLLGRSVCQMLDESLFPDIVFLLKDGSHVLAHGVVLAVRCPSVLPKGLLRQEKKSVGYEVQLSKMISSPSFKALLEYAYSGVVHLRDVEEVDEMKVLSKGCGLDSLTNLLHGRVPVWGVPPASCNLASALEPGGGGFPFADIILRGNAQGDAVAVGEASPCLLEEGCRETCTHVHGHRAILSSRCDYYRGLFCSGMRESTAEAIDINVSEPSLQTLLRFWYSGKLVRLTEATGWCAWNNLETHEQIRYLQALIELAQLAGQLLMTDLQEECSHLVLQHVEGGNVHLAPSVVTHAAQCAQWELVNACAASVAPAYPRLRDTGALESLDDGLRDLLRAAYVQFFSQSEAG